MAKLPLHSWYGFSVGIPYYTSNGNTTTVNYAATIAANGLITAPAANISALTTTTANLGNASANNLSIAGNLTVTGNISGNLSGNLRSPGADTWVLYTIGGNASSSANFTFNPSINFLHVSNGNLCVDNGGSGNGGQVIANYFYGDGSNITNVWAQYSNSVIGNSQPNITSLGTLTSLSVASVGNITIPGGSNGQVLTTNGNGNLYWSDCCGANGISGTGIANGTSNITIADANGPVTISANGIPNIVVVNGPNATNGYPNVVINGELWANGNIRADYFDGDGSRLSNINSANIVGNLTLSGSFMVYCRTVNRPIIIERGEFIISKRGDIPTPIRA